MKIEAWMPVVNYQRPILGGTTMRANETSRKLWLLGRSATSARLKLCICVST